MIWQLGRTGEDGKQQPIYFTPPDIPPPSLFPVLPSFPSPCSHRLRLRKAACRRPRPDDDPALHSEMRIPLTRLYVALLAGLLLFSSSHWQPGPLGAAGLLLSALVLTSLAAIGRLWCSLYIAGYKKSCLVTDGPYSMCRNPLYFFSMLGVLGVALMTYTFTIPVLVLVSFAIYYPIVIRAEEADLMRIHGAPFEAYRRQTPAFFPRWSLLKEPETYQVKPRVFRNHMGSAVWFILAIGLIALLQAGRGAGHIPALITLF